MKLDITFNVYTDANGGDPDSTSPTLRSYHKILWSKPLPNGQTFELDNKKSGTYLYCKLPQKEYVLKVEKTLTLKRKNDEEIKI